MHNKDKLITLLGVIILLSSAVGVYVYDVPHSIYTEKIGINAFFVVESEYSSLPTGIKIPDSNPFYQLIATPLAINYDKDGNQFVAPLYIENYNSPSRAITEARNNIGIEPNLEFLESRSPKDLSLDIASSFWKHSDTILIIEDSQSGYNLGVIATPLASYLSIPVIVTNEIDRDVKNVLKELGVKKSIICGELPAYGDVLKLETPDDITNATIELVTHKFGKVNYITITNPIDTYEPEVLSNVTALETGKITLPGISAMQLGHMVKLMLTDGMYKKYGAKFIKDKQKFEIGSFKIPEDYKYALVKFTGINYQTEGVDLFGDSVAFQIPETPLSGATAHYPNTYDSNGKTKDDVYYIEQVFYDMGGTKFPVLVQPTYTVAKEGDIEVKVEIEKLSDPMYPMMKDLSSISPYLTAYRKGIIWGKSEFAFTADDGVITDEGVKCSGVYMSRYNENLRGPSNNHIIKNIIQPLNNLLAKLANLPKSELYQADESLENLQSHYAENPVYICLVGGATVLPQFVYDCVMDERGAATDVVYGNIDPLPGWKMISNDIYSKYPFQENIVGRIPCWDAQDASALICRTIFYENILSTLGDWKNTASVQTGWGCDFAKPKVLMWLAEKLGTTAHVVEGYEEPLRWPTGYTDMYGDAFQKLNLEPMGFTVQRTYHYESSYEGLSEEALKQLKRSNLLNFLLLSKNQLRNIYGEDNVVGKEKQEESNFIYITGHGSPNLYNSANEELYHKGLGYIFLPQILKIVARVFGIGPGISINTGVFSVKNVEKMNMGPSFIMLSTCLVGWIDGRYPKTCLNQAYIHAGVNAVITAPIETNVPGGYLEPYEPYSSLLGLIKPYIKAKMDARNGIYPEHHFGEKIYEDVLIYLQENDSSMGEALRDARNRYLPEDIDYEMYWSPPLSSGGKKGENTMAPFEEHKYANYQEFLLYGDPAFNPYEPCNQG